MKKKNPKTLTRRSRALAAMGTESRRGRRSNISTGLINPLGATDLTSIMKKLLSSLLLLALVCAVSNALAQYADLPDEDLFRSAEMRYGHLEYFGFYASAMGSWNFTGELASFTNLTWIHVGSADNPEGAIGKMIRRLGEARNAGVQATLSIEAFLFLNERGDLRSDSDIEDFLVELRARIELENLLDTVAMIYPKDEPFREFVGHRDPPFHEQYITGEVYDDIHENLVHVNELIKLVFSEKPIGVILSGHNLTHRFFSIPENYDWIGFDCYSNLFRSCDDRSFVQHYAHLLDFMQAHQRLMAVPESWALNGTFDLAWWPDVLRRRLRHHYEIALNEPRFIAFIPFIWSFDADADVPGLGLNRFPELFDDGVSNRGTAFVNQVMRIGRRIKQGAPRFPNMAYDETEDTGHRPGSNIRGEIMSITRSGLLSAWAFNDALPHKNLRVQVLIRNARGRLIHKSRPERTFVRDPDLGHATRIGRPFVGNHGYRYQFPRKILDRHQGKKLHVELVTYADGSAMEIGHISSLEFIADHKIRLPLQ